MPTKARPSSTSATPPVLPGVTPGISAQGSGSALTLDEVLARAEAAPPDDPYREVRQRTDQHRRRHGCGAYTYDKGPWLGALARAWAPARALELGTAQGYTALCLSVAGGRVDTLEGDATHVEQARAEIERAGLPARVRVHEGDFMVTLPQLRPGYDLVFFDGFAPSDALYREIERLLAPRGLLVSANLNHGSGEDYIARIMDRERWQTRFVDAAKETAVSVRR